MLTPFIPIYPDPIYPMLTPFISKSATPACVRENARADHLKRTPSVKRGRK